MTRSNRWPYSILAVVATSISLVGCEPTPVSATGAPIPLSAIDDAVAVHDTLVTPYEATVEFNNGAPPGTVVPSSTERLVVQFMSGRCSESNSTDVRLIRLTGNRDHYFAPSVQFDYGGGDGLSVYTHPTRFYVNPGTTLQFMAFPTTSTLNATCRVTITGYLVAP